jgi:uncharacterized alkaline shock family protein YloU
MKYGHNIMGAAHELQSRAAKMIEDMTAFNVNRLNIEVRGLK